MSDYPTCPAGAPLYGYMGGVLVIALSSLGSLIGSLYSIQRSKNVLPLLLSLLLGVMGFFLMALIQGHVFPPEGDGSHVYSVYTAASSLAGGLSSGLMNLMSGIAIAWIVNRGHHPKTTYRPAGMEQDELEGLLDGPAPTELKVLSLRDKLCVALAAGFGMAGSFIGYTFCMNMYVCVNKEQ